MYTVLIVEDEMPSRNILNLIADWDEIGFKVIGEADNGQEALKFYEKNKPDVIITDIQMPVMDGIELIENIVKKCPEQIFVILSCHESFAYAQKAIKLGVSDYLIKDMLTKEQIHKSLRQAVERKKKNDEEVSNRLKILSKEYENDFKDLGNSFPIITKIVNRRLDVLTSALMIKEIHTIKKELKMLYEQKMEGIAQYKYLNYLNARLFEWILDECIKHEIDKRQIFSGEEIPSDILQTAKNPAEVCENFCIWIERVINLASDRQNCSSRIRSIIEYIQNNYYMDISLQSIAAEFHIHKVYLARTFKEDTGTTITDYVNKLRIEKAKLLLIISDYKVNDIAYIVGFNNMQNFYNLFKKYVNKSPSEYRKECEQW